MIQIRREPAGGRGDRAAIREAEVAETAGFDGCFIGEHGSGRSAAKTAPRTSTTCRASSSAPGARGPAQARGRHAVGRRAADARDRAGAHGPARCLLLDGPSLGLAPLLIQAVFEAIRKINVAGVAILLVKQKAFVALNRATRSYVLENGREVADRESQALAADPRVKRAYLR
jgi:hypothetical protein